VSVLGSRDHTAYLSALKCRMGVASNQWMISPRRVIRGGLKSAARKVQPLYWLRVACVGSSRGHHQGDRTTGGEVFTTAGVGTPVVKEESPEQMKTVGVAPSGDVLRSPGKTASKKVLNK